MAGKMLAEAGTRANAIIVADPVSRRVRESSVLSGDVPGTVRA
jgi:hypothetical protein